jgi:hypothetical protein
LSDRDLRELGSQLGHADVPVATAARKTSRVTIITLVTAAGLVTIAVLNFASW